MKKLILLAAFCLYSVSEAREPWYDIRAQADARTITTNTHDAQVSNTHNQIKEIAALKCKEAQQDVINEAKGMVFDPAHLKRQKETLEQCRQAGLLLRY